MAFGRVIGGHAGQEGPNRRTFYVACPSYAASSSGIRCLYLLCHHLNRLGCRAYVTGSGAPAGLLAPRITEPLIAANRRLGLEDIVVYPEVIAGNPLKGRNVVRYLLNKPGRFNSVGADSTGAVVHYNRGIGMEGYDPADFFIHFSEEFRPDGVDSHHLALPVIDPNVYREQRPQPPRDGFILYAHRQRPDLAALPSWVSPQTIASMERPRTPAEMADLYRNHVALVIWERTAALGEAIQCGCPVVLVPGPTFQHEPIVRRYQGCGIVVGWDRQGLRHAGETVRLAAQLYWERFRRLDQHLHTFVALANDHFDRAAGIAGGRDFWRRF
jgi:hypothetical protein